MDINRYIGQQIDVDGYPPNQPFQCYDLANRYSIDIGYQRFGGLYASDIFGQQPQNYNWVKNTPSGIPPRGAVVVFTRVYGSGWGHVAITTGEGNTSYFVSLDQNWSAPRVVATRHDYSQVIGWGIPKNSNIINEGAKNMTPDEEKLAYNIVLGREPEPGAVLGDITAWQFIRAAEVELTAIRKENRDTIAKARGEIVNLTARVTELEALVKSKTVDEFSLGQLAGAFLRKIVSIK